MIAYFDTSAIVPLLIGEPASPVCTRLWNDATRAVSIRLLYPEARAALSRALRMDRLSRRQLTAAVAELDALVTEIDHVEITADLARDAGELAGAKGLRGYDAVHLAAAVWVREPDLVVATGDHGMAAAARALGFAVALTA